MGLDGGTYITRSDVLRGQSWQLATADTSRSTRGGDASTSTVRNTADPRDVRRDLLRKQLPSASVCSNVRPQYTPYILHRNTKWSTCSLSNQPLQEPIVADYLGNLYNRYTLKLIYKSISCHAALSTSRHRCQCREAVLEFLLARSGAFVDDLAQVDVSSICQLCLSQVCLLNLT